MCGIVGAVAKQPISKMLIDGLKKLEYRGYDSAGIVCIEDNQFKRVRVVGKVNQLEQALSQQPLGGHTGIAHTRWATHGKPSEENAHPFISNDQFSIVHNGIIENHAELRASLTKLGYKFLSETDTEVIVHLIHHHAEQQDLMGAIRTTVGELKGAYALGIMAKAHPDRLFAVRQGSPLAIGKGHDGNYLTSDPTALISLTREFIYLEDNDIAEISIDEICIYNKANQVVSRELHSLSMAQTMLELGQHRHYMKKEIMEQPFAIEACLEDRLDQQGVVPDIFGSLEDHIDRIEHIQLVACGTSYHAALVARYWLESLTQIPCSVEVASEFRYRDIAPPKNSLFITLSQSGETADSLAALRLAKQMDYLTTLAICNVPGSTMTREANSYFLTKAGIEIGVASTKAFTTQLVSLLLLALSIHQHKNPDSALRLELTQALLTLPSLIETCLQSDSEIENWAYAFTNKNHAIYLGRGALYPIAIEGALKLKEISYIHAEAYP
ncbi:MAG: glutamine--fructose-6-phosphate transaminase (isomerizing), partial [Gammaproteobacteria bacterium]